MLQMAFVLEVQKEYIDQPALQETALVPTMLSTKRNEVNHSICQHHHIPNWKQTHKACDTALVPLQLSGTVVTCLAAVTHCVLVLVAGQWPAGFRLSSREEEHACSRHRDWAGRYHSVEDVWLGPGHYSGCVL